MHKGSCFSLELYSVSRQVVALPFSTLHQHTFSPPLDATVTWKCGIHLMHIGLLIA